MTNASPFVNFFFGNWDMGLITVWETGPRFSVSSGLQTARAGIPSLADLTGSRPIGAVLPQGNGVLFFTPAQVASFLFPAAGGTGTSGRNSFIGPGYFNMDMSLVKTLRVRNERRVSFRIEVYNVINHPNFGLPDRNLSNSTFGQINSMQGYPRQFQMALRYEF